VSDLVDLVGTSPEPSRGTAFLVLLAFLVSFAFIRTSARLIRSPRVPWWPGSVKTRGGLHIHHVVWGTSLLLICGFAAFVDQLAEPWWQVSAIGFGIGAGLTLDEFALYLHLDDVYWAEEGRDSIDAVIMAAVAAALVVIGVKPFGLDETTSAVLVPVVACVTVALAAIAFVKGRPVLGVTAMFVMLVGIFAAVRLARPTSPWARRFYRNSPDKLHRSQERYAHEERVWRRFQDLIGGTPTEG
jgi:hypothetical protein